MNQTTQEARTKPNWRSFRIETVTSSAKYRVCVGRNEFPFTMKRYHLRYQKTKEKERELHFPSL